jgi:hypothetical protein
LKPRLWSASLTDEDRQIWLDVDEAVPGDRWDLVSEICRDSDRRDAHLMLALRVLAEMGPCYLRIGADNYAVPAIQVHLRRNPLFPTGAGYPFNITPAHKGQ